MKPLFLHVDDALIIAEKPAGLLAVPGRGPDKQDCLSARVQACYPDALIVHRLDMDTSGILCFARTAEAQRRLNRAFEERRVGKRYCARVIGRLEGEGEIDLPLSVDWENRPRSKVDPVHGRPSRTRWRAAGYDAASDTTRVELAPVTGRSHQLRVHLAALGFPILGDPLYAPPVPPTLTLRMCLHAMALSLFHPADGRPVTFASPPPF
ncbi:MAG: RluA family pseudouridine synthase [Pseudomonadota bacterium]